jgi:hypothetical protein
MQITLTESDLTGIREALVVWDNALEGDSNDAEYEAGLGMAGILRDLAVRAMARPVSYTPEPSDAS